MRKGNFYRFNKDSKEDGVDTEVNFYGVNVAPIKDGLYYNKKKGTIYALNGASYPKGLDEVFVKCWYRVASQRIDPVTQIEKVLFLIKRNKVELTKGLSDEDKGHLDMIIKRMDKVLCRVNSLKKK